MHDSFKYLKWNDLLQIVLVLKLVYLFTQKKKTSLSLFSNLK